MHACPSCGFANSDDASTCALCGRALPPAAPSEAQAPPAVLPNAQEQQPITPQSPAATPASEVPAAATPPAALPEPPAYSQPPWGPMPTPGAMPIPTQAPPPAGAMPSGGPLPAMPYGAPPPRPPLPFRPPLYTRKQWRNRYLLGLLVGALPALIVMVLAGALVAVRFNSPLANASGPALISAGLLYLASFIGMIVCLSIERLRPIGYGLLTAVIAGPIIASVSCFAAFGLASRPA